MPTVKKKFMFSAAHRLPHTTGKCKSLHGHNYKVTLSITIDELDKNGFVVDFADIKTKFVAPIMERFDHATIVGTDDQELISFLRKQNQKHFVLYYWPTAERIADYILYLMENTCDLNNLFVKALHVEVAETDDSIASIGIIY